MLPRLLRLLLLFLLCSPLFLHAQDAGTPARVNAKSVRLRAEANTKSKVVTTLKKGDEVSIVAVKADWSSVRIGKYSGWIMSSLLDPIEVTASEVKSNRVPAYGGGIQLYQDQPIPDFDAIDPVAHSPGLEGAVLVDAAVAIGGADLRAYPGSQATVLLALPEGSLVTVIDRNELWVKCESAGMTGWVERNKLTLHGTRVFSADAARLALQKDETLEAAVKTISDAELKEAAQTIFENERRLRSSIEALESRSQSGGAFSLGTSSVGEYFLTGLEDDAARLGSACSRLNDLSEESGSESDRIAASNISAAGSETLQRFRETLARSRTSAPSAVLLYGGQFSFAMGSHTRTTIYDYSSSSPTLQSSAWVNTPSTGNFRARLDYSDDIVTTRFKRLNTGVDWRLPKGTHQWSARMNLYSYDDAVPTNTFSLIDFHAGWEQLAQTGPAFFARTMYQGKSFSETQPQDFTAFSINTGVRSVGELGQSYEVNLLNRYQTSDDMGLNFDMINAFGLWRNENGFSLRPAYEGYTTLADSGGAFLNYHRPGMEVRWTKATGITDYGARADYRYHPDAENLTYGQFSVFAGHREQNFIGTNWNALMMFQQNNGLRNPSFVQGNIDARHTEKVYYIGFNAVTRYVLAEDIDSLSQHYADIYFGPGAILEFEPVRIQVGPFIGTTLFLNNKTQSTQDNLNNSARVGLSINALATLGAKANIRAWLEYERAFHFTADPYVGRKREPMRLRLGAEANMTVIGALSVFGRVQSYTIDNDTGQTINLPSGIRDRDKIDDTLLLLGLRYHI
ncbi:MAG: SH3 domain-containing protein [Bacteroidota bacterium]